MILRGNIGLAALLTGDTDAARDAFREELELCRELGRPALRRPKASSASPPSPPSDGDLDRAARLRGAAAAHRYGEPEDAVEARLDATFFATRPHAATGPTPGTPPSAKAAR